MMRAAAYAKVNLGLRVGTVREDGFHPLRSLFQSISLSDRIELEPTESDEGISGRDDRPVPDGERNLAWRAIDAVREAAGVAGGVALRLDKRIPVAAGLGGGSADAAAALHLAQRHFGADPAVVAQVAPTLGSDVPFCIVGGTAVVTGRGDVVAPIPPLLEYALALVVPPVELATPAVYAAWDRLGEPAGPAIVESALPPQLREHGPLVNDLYPAAVSLRPEVDDWRAQLEATWDRPVAMSGSGPTLLGFFVDEDEAGDALAVVPGGARAAELVRPVPVGWRLEEE